MVNEEKVWEESSCKDGEKRETSKRDRKRNQGCWKEERNRARVTERDGGGEGTKSNYEQTKQNKNGNNQNQTTTSKPREQSPAPNFVRSATLPTWFDSDTRWLLGSHRGVSLSYLLYPKKLCFINQPFNWNRIIRNLLEMRSSNFLILQLRTLSSQIFKTKQSTKQTNKKYNRRMQTQHFI